MKDKQEGRHTRVPGVTLWMEQRNLVQSAKLCPGLSIRLAGTDIANENCNARTHSTLVWKTKTHRSDNELVCRKKR